MSTRATRSRRKSGLGGLDEEEKRVTALVQRASRRKSESGTSDLLETRRLLRQLDCPKEEDSMKESEEANSSDENEESDPPNDDESSANGNEDMPRDDAGELAESPAPDSESGEEEAGSKSSSASDESESSDSDGDLDSVENSALDAAVSACLAAAFNQPREGPVGAARASDSSRRRRRQKQALQTRADPSPYLKATASGLTARGDALARPGKGSSIDVESLADQSNAYANRKAATAPSGTINGGIGGRPRPGARDPKLSKPATSGRHWFDLPGTEMTEELKQDLRAVRMRSALDPKRFYKAFDRPKGNFVQVGTVIEGREEYFSSRLTRKERRGNLVEELMADEQARRYTKRKYSSIQTEKQNKRRFGQAKKGSAHKKHGKK